MSTNSTSESLKIVLGEFIFLMSKGPKVTILKEAPVQYLL